MKTIIATLLFVVLFASGVVYAAECPVSNSSDQPIMFSHHESTLVFAGPKLGWIRTPEADIYESSR
jgi:hypothetical protein